MRASKLFSSAILLCLLCMSMGFPEMVAKKRAKQDCPQKDKQTTSTMGCTRENVPTCQSIPAGSDVADQVCVSPA